jgi:hypothetical protein
MPTKRNKQKVYLEFTKNIDEVLKMEKVKMGKMLEIPFQECFSLAKFLSPFKDSLKKYFSNILLIFIRFFNKISLNTK